MDGVAGISQPLVPHGRHFVYRFVADSRARSCTTRTTTKRCSIRDFTARSSCSRRTRSAKRNLAHDFVEMLSAWQIQSAAENHLTINGKEYPATQRST